MSVKGMITDDSNIRQDDKRKPKPYIMQAQRQPPPESPEGTVTDNSTALQVAKKDTKCCTNDNLKVKESSYIAEIINDGILETSAKHHKPYKYFRCRNYFKFCQHHKRTQ